MPATVTHWQFQAADSGLRQAPILVMLFPMIFVNKIRKPSLSALWVSNLHKIYKHDVESDPSRVLTVPVITSRKSPGVTAAAEACRGLCQGPGGPGRSSCGNCHRRMFCDSSVAFLRLQRTAVALATAVL